MAARCIRTRYSPIRSLHHARMRSIRRAIPRRTSVGLDRRRYCNYIPSAQTDLYHPHFANCDNTNTSPLLSAANWQFKDITISKGLDAELDLAAQTSFAKNYSANGHFGVFETGFKISNGHKSSDSTENVYDTFGSSAPLMTQLLDTFNNTDYFGGNFFGGQFGQVSNFTSAANYTMANYQGQSRPAKDCGRYLPESLPLC